MNKFNELMILEYKYYGCVFVKFNSSYIIVYFSLILYTQIC